VESVASIIFAAGKGSRMTGYDGNKTLLPLVPTTSIYQGSQPILLNVIRSLPSGPKGIVVNYRADEVRAAAAGSDIQFILQPVTNGTGGALLSARPFLESVSAGTVIITMGDVPLIRLATYLQLVSQLESNDLVVLAFESEDKAQYGMLEMEADRVKAVVEWKYWRGFPEARQAELRFCNAGVYAAKRPLLLHYLDLLALRPHHVQKEWEGKPVTIEEYFITDLVELMSQDERCVGMISVSEEEVTGVDTPEALKRVQKRYRREL
jgi:bifunctional N-acetylglucosamine-1-phosphate-uridyltransferase/glucosamine-1-phosphate-acetyltransferase GlmU-like protein